MKTITYIVYPPNYKPDDFLKNPYIRTDTKSKAFKIALKLGNDSEIMQNINFSNKRYGFSRTLSGWRLIHNEYFVEFFRNGKYINDYIDMTMRVCDKNRKYAPIYRKHKGK